MTERALLGGIAASAALAIAAAPWALGRPWLAFVFKPLATVLVIALAAGRGAGQPAARRWVLIGLVASLAGDVALLWPSQGFLPGLVSFLLAHLAYLAAFTRAQRFAARWTPFAVYAAVAAAVLAALWPGVPAPLRLPPSPPGRVQMRRRLGWRQPLCGTGVTSSSAVTSRPAATMPRTADSRPAPGP